MKPKHPKQKTPVLEPGSLLRLKETVVFYYPSADEPLSKSFIVEKHEVGMFLWNKSNKDNEDLTEISLLIRGSVCSTYFMSIKDFLKSFEVVK